MPSTIAAARRIAGVTRVVVFRPSLLSVRQVCFHASSPTSLFFRSGLGKLLSECFQAASSLEGTCGGERENHRLSCVRIFRHDLRARALCSHREVHVESQGDLVDSVSCNTLTSWLCPLSTLRLHARVVLCGALPGVITNVLVLISCGDILMKWALFIQVSHLLVSIKGHHLVIGSDLLMVWKCKVTVATARSFFSP